jgi:ABC-type glycerol-3-phosphate transport system permease component
MKMNIGVKRWNISVEIIKLVILIIVVVVFVFPFFWILSNSLKTFSETMTFPPSVFPKKLIFSNYLEALNRMPFFKYLMNSITVNILILVSQFIVIVPASYAFAMYRFRGKGLLFHASAATYICSNISLVRKDETLEYVYPFSLTLCGKLIRNISAQAVFHGDTYGNNRGGISRWHE